ncbi:hypothetical protein ALC57_14856 [Trachymyrmex cornetzi]|uniref:Uncharacterized protein n=1 Tax=Trachymyrmex cornetzi TaxID=471704 RepID=A0A151IXP9_9HYME|nr:hypothetical protein ALC57_14856 [Trachymyrmex cornetzi]
MSHMDIRREEYKLWRVIHNSTRVLSSTILLCCDSMSLFCHSNQMFCRSACPTTMKPMLVVPPMLLAGADFTTRDHCRPCYRRLQYRLSIIPYVKRCIKTRVTLSTFHIYLSAPVGGTADPTLARVTAAVQWSSKEREISDGFLLESSAGGSVAPRLINLAFIHVSRNFVTGSIRFYSSDCLRKNVICARNSRFCIAPTPMDVCNDR